MVSCQWCVIARKPLRGRALRRELLPLEAFASFVKHSWKLKLGKGIMNYSLFSGRRFLLTGDWRGQRSWKRQGLFFNWSRTWRGGEGEHQGNLNGGAQMPFFFPWREIVRALVLGSQLFFSGGRKGKRSWTRQGLFFNWSRTWKRTTECKNKIQRSRREDYKRRRNSILNNTGR